jgi:RHS repeat-associated protein
LRYIDDLICRQQGSEKLYSIADPNWNVVGICDAYGNVQERYTYDAFGKLNVFDTNFVSKIASEFNWNRAFTGQVIDFEMGLMLYRSRFYNSVLGRFVSRDPIGYLAEDINTYRVISNKAIFGVDPFGHEIYPIGPIYDISDIAHQLPPDSPYFTHNDPIKKRCQRRAPNQNGCGSKGGTKVPGNYYGLFNFTPACNAHDLCWGTCGSDMVACNNQFLKDMLDQCNHYYSWFNPLSIDVYMKCRNIAYLYYWAVLWFGDFDKAQNEHCIEVPANECCPELEP